MLILIDIYGYICIYTRAQGRVSLFNRMRREALRDPGLPSGGRAAVPKRQEDWKVVVLKPRFL